MLRQRVIARRGRPAKIIIGQLEVLARFALGDVHFLAIVRDLNALGLRRELGGRAVLIGGADIEHVMPQQAAWRAHRHPLATWSPARFPRCLTPLIYGRADVTQDTRHRGSKAMQA